MISLGFRFRRSVSVGKYVRINFNKNSVSISGGGRGCRCTINSKGTVTTTLGIPGTGLSYVQTSNLRKSTNPISNSTTDTGAEYHMMMTMKRADQALKDEQEKLLLLQNNHHYFLDLSENPIYDLQDEILVEIKPPFVFDNFNRGPNEINAQNILDSFTPNLIQKLIPGMKNKIIVKLSQNIIEARLIDRELFSAWEKEQQSEYLRYEKIKKRNEMIREEKIKYNESLKNSKSWSDLLSKKIHTSEIMWCEDLKIKVINKFIDIDMTLDFSNVFPKKKVHRLDLDGYYSHYLSDWHITEKYKYFLPFIQGRAISIARTVISLINTSKIRVNIFHPCVYESGSVSLNISEPVLIFSIVFSTVKFKEIDFMEKSSDAICSLFPYNINSIPPKKAFESYSVTKYLETKKKNLHK